MPIAPDEVLLVAIRKTLPSVEECRLNPASVANFIDTKFHQISKQLEPMIGVRGIEVLFNRSLQLASQEYPWLVPSSEQFEEQHLIAYLNAPITEHEPHESIAACYAILVAFIGLLISLIGISLTHRLLLPIWEATPQNLLEDLQHE